jgi:hypothetical protein
LSGLGKPLGLSFPVHSTGYALAARGMDTRRLQHFDFSMDAAEQWEPDEARASRPVLSRAASITNTVRYTAMSPQPSNIGADLCQSRTLVP